MSATTNRGNGLAIEARCLTKRYGDVLAVDRLDLEVRRGEVFAFLGRNGAGKTTTIRAMLGLVRPTGGDVLLFGRSASRDRRAALGKVGFLVETAAAYPNLTVRENLDIQRRLTNAPPESVDRAIRLLGLEPYARRAADHLSLGNKQRLSLARALLHGPELVILDEPANGLDPAGIIEIRTLLRCLAIEEGVTVFVSSHILAEVEQLADRIAIIHEGRLVEVLSGDEAGSRRRLGVELDVDDPEKAERILRERLDCSAVERPGGPRVRVSGAGIDPAAVAREIVQAGLSLSRLEPIVEDLEARFMRLTGGKA